MTVSRFTCISRNGSVSFLFMAESYSTVYMCHKSFIHCSVIGHLVCFHFLAIVNIAAMDIEVHVSFGIMNIRSGVGFLGHIVALFLAFRGTSVQFSIVAASVYIPTNSVEGFHFLHIPFSICFL